ncbi:MAG: hypothetical protein IJB58_01330 [Bacteroidales bacterium]|nr:hypothetical protein [Bacteroidales bacterium]
MKRFLLVAVLSILSLSAANAQGGNGYRNAIGIRGGYGAEVSYQRYIIPEGRIEATMGANRYGFSVEGMYQWMFDFPASTAGIWQWYAGAGLGMGGWTNDDFKHGFAVGVLAQIGIEYSFNIPLMLSLDYRPGIYFVPNTSFDYTGLALGVRYCF